MLGQTNRCPGSAERDPGDGSTPFRPDAGLQLRPRPGAARADEAPAHEPCSAVRGRWPSCSALCAAGGEGEGAPLHDRAGQRLRPRGGRRRARGRRERRQRAGHRARRAHQEGAGRGGAHRDGLRLAALRRLLRVAAAVADRRVLRGLPARHRRRGDRAGQPGAGGADRLHDPAGPDPERDAAALPRALPADRERVRRRPGGAARGPERRRSGGRCRRCARPRGCSRSWPSTTR